VVAHSAFTCAAGSAVFPVPARPAAVVGARFAVRSRPAVIQLNFGD
jgi:hypothetical protein